MKLNIYIFYILFCIYLFIDCLFYENKTLSLFVVIFNSSLPHLTPNLQRAIIRIQNQPALGNKWIFSDYSETLDYSSSRMCLNMTEMSVFLLNDNNNIRIYIALLQGKPGIRAQFILYIEQSMHGMYNINNIYLVIFTLACPEDTVHIHLSIYYEQTKQQEQKERASILTYQQVLLLDWQAVNIA